MIRIVSAKFLTSSVNSLDAPDFGISEVAFLGRSNVGKSSIINALTNHQGLAKSSSTPGKTQLINFFEVIFDNDGQKIPIIFVDLPGFGYAKVSKSLHSAWQKNLDEFLRNRINIKTFVHLVDSRHSNLEKDENLGVYLSEFIRNDQKILNLYTKCDKLNQSERSKVLKMDSSAILVSSTKKTGIDKAVKTIYNSIFGLVSSDDNV
ncbi:ribosome biogenesis GTP-binding protein YihA/YsxC [Campylobacter fetus]|uniref:Probable GTP-binding protein EngB n=1 Tax=Campylobacter fetus subsp. testudinum TaxID=1507806 RepID=A0AAX0HDR6_CAMFE|nr:ribosome biogenesis GTP-binding protein YihA/YsxC [Campylobacter fetus]AGZ82022.1 ribosome biogenesis GTP-binding protein YsxC/EngB [Campylobacter fetus subsp. testudinum 03-427]AJB45757.1 GTP-binding protein [Campylobacter fetus subsp. testudinum]ALV65188.1 ribosome biogenesis GTP-binding protein YsxC/EngB [Campylobacter fetus subsp. testudinum Sp3]AVK81456.1 YihA family ribosome biogenesis GTP-binding protein [Campylobacter fetus subsp. testudinum]EAI4321891.1 YihA family ribosome biogene